MRIARFDAAGKIGIGRVEGDEVIVLDAPDVVAAVTGARETGERLALTDVRLLAPIPKPAKFLAIGFNYADHIAEAGSETPTFPVFFNKQTSCITGPFDPIVVPKVSALVDYEGELGVVIGTTARKVSAADAPAVVAGYLVVDDVSVRDWQFKAPTMTLGKSFDTHGPIGPWLVTADEITEPHGLGIRTTVNGELLQDGNTKDMLFDIWQQIETLSIACTLEPGDIIATGTPAGIGITRKPPILLKPGDTVRIEIDSIGAIENPVIAEADQATDGT
jgi:2-keto-4-pentenoate hydratase/2-oxohepta-3-ene-1,7-dioic acid hydratase in catechol pathway